MQIPQHLPQYTDENVLLIVAGSKAAKLYLACNGQLEPVHAFDEPAPQYSDREEHFERSGHGQYYGSGSSYEADGNEERAALITDVSEAVERIDRDINLSAILLTAPAHVLPAMQDALPANVTNRLRATEAGNFLQQPPLSVLEHVITPKEEA